MNTLSTANTYSVAVAKATAQAIDTKTKNIKNYLVKDDSWEKSLKAEFPAMVEKIITLAHSEGGKWFGHYDRAANVADAVKHRPTLLKAWSEAVKGRIPYTFVQNDAGRLVLSAKNPALLMTAVQLAKADADKAANKENGLKKAAETRKNKDEKAKQADMLKAELAEKEKELMRERKAAIAAKAELASSSEIVNKAEKLSAAILEAEQKASKAEKALKSAEEKNIVVSKERDALKGIEADLLQERKISEQLRSELKDALLEIKNRNKTIAVLQAEIAALKKPAAKTGTKG